MAKYKIKTSLLFSTAAFLISGSLLTACVAVQAAAPGNDATAAINSVTSSAVMQSPQLATFTPLVLPSATITITATYTPTATATETPTLAPSPTIQPTATPTPLVIPSRSSLNYIALSRMNTLEQLAVIRPTPQRNGDSAAGEAAATGAFSFSADGRWLALADGPALHVWDLNAGQLAADLSAEGANFNGPLAFHPNSRRLVALDSQGLIHSWLMSTENGQFAPGPIYAPAEVEQIVQIAFTLDGSRLVGLGSQDEQGVLLLWETATGNRLLHKQTGLSAVLSSPAFGHLLISPNGEWIVQAGQEGILRFWVPITGKSLGQQVIYACPDSLIGAAFSRDSSILALQCDGETEKIFLDAPNYYSPGDRQLAGVLEDADPGPGLLSFNRDNALLAAAAGLPARQVQLWNLISKTPIRSLVGFEADIQQLGFSPDGKWLAVREADGTVELWGVRR